MDKYLLSKHIEKTNNLRWIETKRNTLGDNVKDSFEYISNQFTGMNMYYKNIHHFTDPITVYQMFSYAFATGGGVSLRRTGGEYDNDLIDFFSVSLNAHREVRAPEQNYFTDTGKKIMDDIISQKENIIKIPGLRENENKELGDLLDLVEKRYTSGKLIPSNTSM